MQFESIHLTLTLIVKANIMVIPTVRKTVILTVQLGTLMQQQRNSVVTLKARKISLNFGAFKLIV
jgi:hypothetical protein